MGKYAQHIEDTIGDQKLGDEVYEMERGSWQVVHQSLIISSYLAAFAGVEAHINEVIDSMTDTQMPDSHYEFDNDKQQNIREFLPEDPNDIYWKPTLSKYQTILEESDSKTFDESEKPYKEMDYVRELRNYFAHHEPDWIEARGFDEPPDFDFLELFRTGDVETVPWYIESVSPYFPDGVTSADSTKTVVYICLEFIEGFHDRLGTDPRYYEGIRTSIDTHYKAKWGEVF